jgi:hypothetical protein
MPNEKLVKMWIEKGHSILSKDKWDLWDKIVPIRLDDLYHGMELRCCLEICEILKTGDFVKARQTMENQNHSGMSWGLVRSMIYNFAENGKEFAETL